MNRSCLAISLFFIGVSCLLHADEAASERRMLYVAEPGIRNYVEYGGHGILVFDIDDEHKFVKRIPTGGVNEKGEPLNVKGVCASAITKRIYVSTLRHMLCVDLVTEKLLWERTYEKGCDRMSISPGSATFWYRRWLTVVDVPN